MGGSPPLDAVMEACVRSMAAGWQSVHEAAQMVLAKGSEHRPFAASTMHDVICGNFIAAADAATCVSLQVSRVKVAQWKGPSRGQAQTYLGRGRIGAGRQRQLCACVPDGHREREHGNACDAHRSIFG